MERERLLALLAKCLDVGFGTLWWIREDLLKDFVSEYDQTSDRVGHPGLSLRQAPIRGLYEIVPLLHGTSGNRGPVVVRGLSERGADYSTSFGRLLFPARIPVAEFVRPAPDADPEKLTGPWHKRCRITANWLKPRLAESELAALHVWAGKLIRT